ncbi:MAG: hypothetical protein IVW54_02295 [Candidatus Binataceae bacterium]|nr:hypothetical protein [Candidatus Binataceae bacterium]
MEGGVGRIQEAYHAPFLHGKAYPDQIAWNNNQFAHLLGVELYKRHRALSIEGNPDHEPTGVAEVLFRRTGNVFTALKKNKHLDMQKLPRGVNPTRDANWAFDIYVVFPNFYIATMRAMPFVTYHFWPVAADRTIWQTDHYMAAPKNAGELLSQHFSKAFARDVQREDLITLENTQSVLRSGAITSLTLSDQEVSSTRLFAAK